MDFPRGIRPCNTGIEVRFQHQGKRYSRTIKCKNPYSKRSITEAIRERDELKRRVELGAPLDERSGDITLAQLCQDYLETLDIDYSSIKSYIGILNHHWIPNFGHLGIKDIKAGMIKKYLAALPIKNKTKRNILIPLRCAFDHAVQEELIGANPITPVKVKKGQQAPVERFSVDEEQRVMNQLEGQIKLYFTFMFDTGMRPGEILGLTWSDIGSDYVRVSKSIVRRKLKDSTKNHEVRDVWMTDRLRSLLNRHTTRFQDRHVFLNSVGGPYLDTDAFNQAWRRALRKAKVPYRIPYVCRHTRASRLLTAGASPSFAAGQMGHTVEMFFRTYAKWINEIGDKKQVAILKQMEKEQ